MEKTYSLNDLALITGYTTRTLRNYLALGALDGEKIDGVWQFTEEQISAFMSKPDVLAGIEAKHRSVAFDFLSDTRKQANEMLVVLDLPVGMGEAQSISNFFCRLIPALETERFRYAFDHHRGVARFYISGPEQTVRELVKAYYEKKEDK